jgi:invasion protein IalB
MVRKQTGQRVLSVSIAYAPSNGRYVAQFAVPYGVSLADGIVVDAGSFVSSKLQYRRCDRGGCYAEFVMAPDLLDAFKAATGTDATLKITAVSGQAFSFKLSLKGFKEAHDAMVDHAKKRTQPS